MAVLLSLPPHPLTARSSKRPHTVPTPPTPPAADPLAQFSPAVADWFRQSFTRPTAVQAEAFAAIGRGEHCLLTAPTGSGKTLAAFLTAIDRLAAEHSADEQQDTDHQRRGVRVLYISPLKALGVDIDRNLTAPLVGIAHAAALRGEAPPQLHTAVRSGDTPASDRARMRTHPPDILITTPESLYLMLTSQVREILRTVDCVIVDEIHALAGTKRGAHLAVSLERLDELTTAPLQRIGLSATVTPLQDTADFLTGHRPVTIINPPAAKSLDITVRVPVPDLTNLPQPEELGIAPAAVTDSALPTRNSIWPFVEADLMKRLDDNRTTLIFVNSRRTAERLTSRLNELHAARCEDGWQPQQIRRLPAQTMGGGQSDVVSGAPATLARAHHGSVSKDQRAEIETLLKSGQLPCVVATSSLELGIDMGAIDEVIHIGCPPSVAAALQRTGRAGHQVGEVSRTVLYPLHAVEVWECAAMATAMAAGALEATTLVRNPIDVLAQQLVAMTAVAPATGLAVEDAFALVRRSANYHALPREIFDSVVGMLAGDYPATDFAGLAAQVDYDRTAGVLHPRRGTQRRAITGGGTIPDRGLFGVFLVGSADPAADPAEPRGAARPQRRIAGRRVGELDEEMVHESRVGDVISLGASSWRVEEITHDRVLVSPAPGQSGRLPFWMAESQSRDASFIAHLDAAAQHPEQQVGLDENALDNLRRLLQEQRSAVATLPSAQQLVIESFRDEVGDWRVVIHSHYGRAVNAVWAQLISAELQRAQDYDPQAVASNNGIMLRLPDQEGPPDVSAWLVTEPAEIPTAVAAGIEHTALFAGRFRECAARALVLPPSRPGTRAPLWQQRQRAAQLLSVTAAYPQFPVRVEAARECLADVYDLPALTSLMEGLSTRRIPVLAVTTSQPSPCAQAQLMSYTAAFMYEGDIPTAERRAALLSLDFSHLAQLLGTTDLSSLLDAEIIAAVEAELQWCDPQRQFTHRDGVEQALRQLGPLTVDELTQRAAAPELVAGWLEELHTAGQIMPLRRAEVDYLAAASDAAALRDGLGVPTPAGVVAGIAPVDPVDGLVRRYARTHGPFTARALADRFGLPVGLVRPLLDELTARGELQRGLFRSAAATATADDAQEQQYITPEILRRIRVRTLAAAREAVAPVSPAAYVETLHALHGLTDPGSGVDGVLAACELIAGVRLPISALDTLVLAPRVRDYQPWMLDELLSAGEVVLRGEGAAGLSDGWVSVHPVETAELTLARRATPVSTTELSPTAQAVLRQLEGGAQSYRSIADQLSDEDAPHGEDALWELFWAGLITPHSAAPLRAVLAGAGKRSGGAHRAPVRGTRPQRLRMGRSTLAQSARAHRLSAGSPRVAGLWSALPLGPTGEPAEQPDTMSQLTHLAGEAELLLDQYGLITKGIAHAVEYPGGFAALYRVLSGLEDAGIVQRGWFVDGLGAAQFATTAVVNALRDAHSHQESRADQLGTALIAPQPLAEDAVVLAASDPANPFGAALDWPPALGTARPARKAGAIVIMVDGQLVAYLERGGKTLLLFETATIPEEAPAALTPAQRAGLTALREVVAQRRVGELTITTLNGEAVLTHPLVRELTALGYALVPQGVRVRHA